MHNAIIISGEDEDGHGWIKDQIAKKAEEEHQKGKNRRWMDEEGERTWKEVDGEKFGQIEPTPVAKHLI